MPANPSKHDAVKRFIEHEGWPKEWIIRVVDQPHDSVLQLEGFRDDVVETGPERTFDLQVKEIQLEDNELDEETKTTIRGWVASLDPKR